MIDAHVHMDRYGEELDRALSEIRRLGIRTLAVSMDPGSFRETLRIAAREPLVLPSFGVHPWEAPRFAGSLEELEPFLAEAPLLGEIGLDRRFVEDASLYPAQEKVFAWFLDAAERWGRLVNLHTSGAEARVLEALAARELRAVVVHWYSGPEALVERYLELGAWFTVGVEVLRSERIRRLAALLPADRILTETDNPGGWRWLTDGETGMPALVEQVEEEVARIRGVERGVLSKQVEENFRTALAAGGVALSEGG